MRLLDLAWDTVTNVGQRDYDTLRLILDEKLPSPILTSDKRGLVVKLPVPTPVDESTYSLHGLQMDTNERSWAVLWRLFKASLYHASLHAAYSDFGKYTAWARGKDLNTATYSVSLVEDLNVTIRAMKRWPGLMNDLMYANYISSLRVRDVNSLENPSLRFATKLLMSVWGVHRERNSKTDEDLEVQALASTLRSISADAGKKKVDVARSMLIEAAQDAYASVIKRGPLTEVPYFPHTEAHGPNSIFVSRGIREPPDSRQILSSAYAAIGLKQEGEGTDKNTLDDAIEAYHNMITRRDQLAKVLQRYEAIISKTRLDGVEFPNEDYSVFLRVRSDLSGPIRTIRDQLRLVKNVLDDESGHESGQVDTQAAMQVVASGKMRTDIFQRDENVSKEEAWAILLDDSKSISSFSHEVKGIATCLSEVAKELIPRDNQWAAYAFNSSLQIIKDFDEGYSLDTKARIGGLVHRHATLLPDAMSTCHKILMSRPVDLRILVVVSDGYPTGYLGIEKNLVSTIKEISKTGTLLIGIGVDSTEIAEYFATNCVLDNPYHMMKSFVKSYLELSSLF
ncbi:MAG: hypothetical protein HYY68_06620 [Thaumarchaeota archaeon]|nr:hypothetical protein [Nitrososphaerota archaeon]